MMKIKNVRLEVMQAIEPKVVGFMEQFLVPIDKIWQPTDFLPDSESDDFLIDVHELRELSKELPYDFWIVLIGDMITEEALPTYESWLMDVEGISQHDNNGWSQWVRHWTAEENRHGDVLNKYLYLSGRVNMRSIEKSIQYLIADGYDIGTSQDPYKNFVYTSFQELATHLSHKRVAKLATKWNNPLLAKMCSIIASDERRHYLAYRTFVKEFFEHDPSGIMIAFAEMMKNKIVMPAHFLRECGQKVGDAFTHFSHAAQRLGVYTSSDYVDILNKLIAYWDIENVTDLNEEAEKSRDFLVKLPARLERLMQRMVVPEESMKFQWVTADGRL